MNTHADEAAMPMRYYTLITPLRLSYYLLPLLFADDACRLHYGARPLPDYAACRCYAFRHLSFSPKKADDVAEITLRLARSLPIAICR